MEMALSIHDQRARRVANRPNQVKFLALVDDHGPSVLAMLRRLCGNSHDAEDAFQETAIRAWRGFNSRPKLRNPRAWLMTIAYRAFVDHYRKRSRSGPLPELVDSDGPSPERLAERSEDAQRLERAIAQLSKPVREVVILHYTGGLTIRQTADALELAQGTVKSRLNAGLAKLRSALQ